MKKLLILLLTTLLIISTVVGGITCNTTDNTETPYISNIGFHSLRLRSDGSLWAWGSNSHGQLGLGDYGSGTDRLNPTHVGIYTDWITVSAGTSGHSLGLRSDGSLWTWGKNYWGQLGLGDSALGTYRSNPTRVGNDTDWVTVSAGEYHSLGLRSDGSLWAWGNNTYGQLGLGDTTDRNIPTQVGNDTDWVAVFA